MNERIYQDDEGLWYYRARGKQNIGPFDSQPAAERALNKQIRSWAGRAKPKATWPRAWNPTRIFRRSAPRQS